MADVTGPIHTLPGAGHAVPEGMACDDHPNRPATHRVQGETDSMGCEMYDLCDECYAEWKAHGIYKPDRCDWCEEQADDCRPIRDYEEGMCGPVYYVCGECRRRLAESIADQEGDHDWDDRWDDYDDDSYRAEVDETWEKEFVEEEISPRMPEGHRSLPAIVNCSRCHEPWKPGHECRGVRAARAVRHKIKLNNSTKEPVR